MANYILTTCSEKTTLRNYFILKEYETDEGICYQDFDCYRTQKCCYAEHGDNFCCYKDEETQEEVELHWILIVGGVLLFLLVVVITIGCVCCYCVNQNSKNAKKERKNVKKNRVADNPTMMNRNMQEPTFLYTRNNLMNNIPAPICQVNDTFSITDGHVHFRRSFDGRRFYLERVEKRIISKSCWMWKDNV